MKSTVLTAAILITSLGSLSGPVAAHACLKGAAAGGVVGHFAHHHAVAGAAIGCAIGHHRAHKRLHQKQPTSVGTASGGL